MCFAPYSAGTMITRIEVQFWDEEKRVFPFDALLDSGSPHVMLPGNFETRNKDGVEVCLRGVKRGPQPGEQFRVRLSPMGETVDEIAGLEGNIASRRLLFYAELVIPGFLVPDMLPVCFHHDPRSEFAVIGRDLLLMHGGICLKPTGYRPRLCHFHQVR